MSELRADKSSSLFHRAQRVIPGGVNSPVRAFRAVGRDPATLTRSASVLVDFDDPYGRPGQVVPSLTGSPRELADAYLRYAETGVDHLQLYPDPCTVDGIKRCAEALEYLA